MSINTGLILCAGKGTRMGAIGKVLPKPLWPLFEKTLIDWQIIQMMKLGIKNIYINTHHGHELITEHVNKNWQGLVHLIHEKILLNVGGAIANLKHQTNSEEKLLVVTTDMISSLDKKDLEAMENKMAENIACLLLMKVEKKSKYNKVIFENDTVIDIISSNQDDHTFSGMSLINLKKIKAGIEPETFFDSLLNYKKNPVKTYFRNDIEFFDLGTMTEFVSSHEKLFESFQKMKNDQIVEDLKKYHFIPNGLESWIDCLFQYIKIEQHNNVLSLKYKEIVQEIELSMSKS